LEQVTLINAGDSRPVF